jgi:uncharacterized protein (DUF2141 family)
VYKKTPRYITNTLDSLKTFRLENLKSGKYLLVAMKDYNSNNKFDPKKDKIGFHKEFVSVPNDTVYEMELFKETVPFKAFKPAQVSGNKLFLGFEGNLKLKENRPQIVLKNKDQIIPSIVTQLPKKDSLQVWYKPLKVDSLSLEITQNKYKNIFNFRIKDQKKDTLNIKAVHQGVLNFRDRFALESATPLTNFDVSKIHLTNKSKEIVPFTTEYDEFHQLLYLDFKRETEENYQLLLSKGALTDFLEKTSDSLNFRFSTKALADYGNLTVNLQNAKRFPIMVELTNEKGDVLAMEYSEKSTSFQFNLLEPAKYFIRAIYDENNNKIYDPGNYLAKKQSEEVIYFSKEVDVRANWDVVQIFDLSIPYTPEPKKGEKKTAKKKTTP